MTAPSTIEAKLRDRGSSTGPAEAAGKVPGGRPPEPPRRVSRMLTGAKAFDITGATPGKLVCRLTARFDLNQPR